jgi:hypothetical protein
METGGFFMMKKLKIFAVVMIAAILVAVCFSRECRAQIAGIQIDGGVPASAADGIAAAGFNSVVIYCRPYKTADDAVVNVHLEQWGARAAALDFNLYARIDTGPPLDAVADTAKIKYRYAATDDGYQLSTKPAPASAEFWRTAIFPKIDRLAEMSAKLPIRGVFLNLGGHVGVSYDIDTYSEFLKTREPGFEPGTLDPRSRKSHLIEKGLLEDYEKYQEDIIYGFVREYMLGLKTRAPKFEIHFASWEENPLHRGFARAVAEVFPESGLTLYAFHSASDKGSRPASRVWIPELSVRDFTPDEMAAMAGALGLWKSGFLISDAEALWKDLKNITVSEWPLGLTEDYMRTVSGAKNAGDAAAAGYGKIVEQLADRVVESHSGTPKIALIYSGYMGYMYRDVFDILLAKTDIKVDKYENTKLDKLIPKLNEYGVIVTAPGYNAVKSDKFYPYAGEILKFVKNGGAIIILDATTPAQTNWLGKADPELSLTSETKTGLSPKWVDSGFRMMGYPNRLKMFPMGSSHFSDAATGWRQIARDNEDKPYVVQRLYGDGMIIVVAHMMADPEFLINGWEYMLKVKDRFDVEIDPHAKPIGVGRNEIPFEATTLGLARRLKVYARIMSEDRKQQTAEVPATLTSGGGARFVVPLVADGAGLYRMTLTFFDEDRGGIDRRDSFSFLAPAPFEATLDKSYYTSESEAVVRVDCRRIGGCGKFYAGVKLETPGAVEGVGRERVAGGSIDFKLPIGNLAPGEYRVSAAVEDASGARSVISALLRKLPPGPAVETKLLNFRGGLLEVDGRPYFPLGIYSIPPENLDELHQTGVNGMIFYGNTVQSEADMNKSLDGKGILFAAYPIIPQTRYQDESRATLEAEIRDKAKNDNMFMWYLADEPEGFGQSPELIYGLYSFVKEIDPYRPQAIVMMTPADFPRYVSAADIFMFDRYPTPLGPLESVGLYARRAIQAVYGRKPVFAIPQAFSWEVWEGSDMTGKEHRPNYIEMRSSAIQCIAADVKGIIYWAFTASRYDMRKFPEHEKDFERLMTELSGLVDVLEEPNVYADIKVEPDFTGIDWGAKIHDGRMYIFAYNGGPDVTDPVKFVLPENISGKTVEVYGENRTIAMQGHGFTDAFDYYAAHIYIVPVGNGVK